MTDSPNAKYIQLYSHQRDFVQHYKRSEFPRRAVLVAPVGTGKTTAVASILEHLYSRNPSLKALYITAGSPFTNQLEHRMTRMHPEVITKSRVRETTTTSAVSRMMKRSALALVASQDFRDSWLRSALEQSRWDIVVIDDEYLPFDAIELVEAFLTRTEAAALAIFRTLPPTAVESTWSVFHWDIESLKFSKGVSDYPVRIHIAPYSSSAQENDLLKRVDEISESIARMAEVDDLGRVARSSLYAAQAACLQVLDKLRTARNELAHGRVGTQDDSVEADERRHYLADLMALMPALDELIDDIDLIDRDSRFELLGSLLSRDVRPSADDPVVVYTSDYRTRSYLVENLALHIDLEVGELGDQEAAGGAHRDAVIVAEDGSVQGVELRARRAVSYDSQYEVERGYMRLARLQPEPDMPVEYWLLVDLSQSKSEVGGDMLKSIGWIRDAAHLLKQKSSTTTAADRYP